MKGKRALWNFLTYKVGVIYRPQKTVKMKCTKMKSSVLRKCWWWWWWNAVRNFSGIIQWHRWKRARKVGGEEKELWGSETTVSGYPHALQCSDLFEVDEHWLSAQGIRRFKKRKRKRIINNDDISGAAIFSSFKPTGHQLRNEAWDSDESTLKLGCQVYPETWLIATLVWIWRYVQYIGKQIDYRILLKKRN